jgi:hypothetical protein
MVDYCDVGNYDALEQGQEEVSPTPIRMLELSVETMPALCTARRKFPFRISLHCVVFVTWAITACHGQCPCGARVHHNCMAQRGRQQARPRHCWRVA